MYVCNNNERKGHEFEGGEKGWKAWFSRRKRNGKHNYIIISQITLNRAKENAKLKSLFFKKKISPFLWCSDNNIFFQGAKTTFLGGRNQHRNPTLKNGGSPPRW